ncbi:MAG TPA: endonuclease domain-containing protein [Caldithrix abyssi]|uniref:Endonuclease domain-containing protein n=1 Tax=Caldithrix abyssi TaxID=187145 RepID=A0A7V4TZ45_CALAY|nr:endonuclease domain-containing protein [Caldithrix abyssi]
MTIHFNKHKFKETRKKLRNNPTQTERILWDELKGKKLGGFKFRRQYGIDQFVIDFYCPRIKLAVELDGSVHQNSDIKNYDRERQKYIETFGVTFLRFKNSDVLKRKEWVLEQILVTARRLTTTPKSPPCKGGDLKEGS